MFVRNAPLGYHGLPLRLRFGSILMTAVGACRKKGDLRTLTAVDWISIFVRSA